jgi:hypothetical protein
MVSAGHQQSGSSKASLGHQGMLYISVYMPSGESFVDPVAAGAVCTLASLRRNSEYLPVSAGHSAQPRKQQSFAWSSKNGYISVTPVESFPGDIVAAGGAVVNTACYRNSEYPQLNECWSPATRQAKARSISKKRYTSVLHASSEVIW